MLEFLDKVIKNRAQILDGLKNNVLTSSGLSNVKKEAIFSERKKVCNACPLHSNGRCEDKKVISRQDLCVENFDRKTMSLVVLEKGNPKEYYMTKDLKQVYRGCGCYLRIKQKSEQAYCPVGFWGGEFKNLNVKSRIKDVKKCKPCKTIR